MTQSSEPTQPHKWITIPSDAAFQHHIVVPMTLEAYDLLIETLLLWKRNIVLPEKDGVGGDGI